MATDNYSSDIILETKNIRKTFEKKAIIEDLSLQIKRNEFLTILGPSGCGKTTTLRIIGGFEKPDSGTLLFDGKDITNLPPEKRELNTVFQKYSLFPHMNVEENIAYGLRLKKKDSSYIRDKVKYALNLVDLNGYEKRKPNSLSGGQQQRIAIARAIVNEPKVLLLDEPLGALDLKLRKDMQRELIRLKNELGITFIYVSHDQEEALTMSDRIIVMNHGIIQQIGTPEDIYNEPQNAFVADFIGESNIVDGVMVKNNLVTINGTAFACEDTGFEPYEPVDVVIRPEDVELTENGEGVTTGVVKSITFKGVHYEIDVESAIGIRFLVHTTKHFAKGSNVGINVIPYNIQIMHKPVSIDEEKFDKESV